MNFRDKSASSDDKFFGEAGFFNPHQDNGSSGEENNIVNLKK